MSPSSIEITILRLERPLRRIPLDFDARQDGALKLFVADGHFFGDLLGSFKFLPKLAGCYFLFLREGYLRMFLLYESLVALAKLF